MKSYLLKFLLLLNISFINATCPVINSVPNFNLTEYIKDKWYIQKQQETFYLPLNSNYCVTAEYKISNTIKIPFYSGTVLSVYNHANLNNVSGGQLNRNNYTLCARIPNSSNPSKLLVGQCFLPNFLSGDYWVVDVGPKSYNYQWAVVIGGQPTQEYKDGCTTKINSINGAGLWIFSRNQTISNELMKNILDNISKLGISVSQLNNVLQKNCVY